MRVRDFMDKEVRPRWDSTDHDDRKAVVKAIVELRDRARNEWKLWLPHMPAEWGGMGLGPTAMAAVSAEAAKVGIGPFVLNAQAPDEGNQHTLLHWGTPEQKEKYLRPLCEGTTRSCFAMTEPEVAGSDPTLIKTHAYQDGDEWVLNGHKWFISGARGARFALVIARTEDNPDLPQAANSCFIVDIPTEGFDIVRDIETMSGSHNHCEIFLRDVRVSKDNMLGGRGQGHLLGQYRLGPARLAHCMRWIGQAETALDMMVKRSLERFSHGSLLAEKQGIQWLIADSTVELYQCKLMVLHAAYRIEH
ncbi:MAG: acyl-CoA dehydrogenase, partial [Actinobacteria bacterium]|nr:acyl-CoA dehydrogenase [Actinomycetota bacterium]